MRQARLRLHRYNDIGRVLVRHGFEGLVHEVGVADVLGSVRRLKVVSETAPETRPSRLRRTLEDLGTTFIKLGQVLSTRPDLLPPDYIAELSRLQDDVAPEKFADISAVLLKEFGCPPDDIFLEFDPVPRAAASIGQVHNARLKNGTPVVVKVRRPGIEIKVEEDLAILADLARLVSQNSKIGKLYDLEEWVQEFGTILRNEMDYSREGRNADRIRGNFKGDPAVKVPVVYWEYTTPAVLTMEEMVGIKIGDLAAIDDAGIEREKLAERCAHIAVVQVLEHGFFHADPHPGNFFVLANGVVGLIDYGMVGRLDEPLRNSLIRLSLAAMRQDADRFIDEMLAMGMASGPIRRAGLRRDLRNIHQKYEGQSLGTVSIGKVFNDVTGIALRYGLRVPSELMLLLRVVAMDEGMGAHLDPEFNLIAFARPYLHRFWSRSYSPAAIKNRLQENAIDLGDAALELPQKLRHLLGQIERGEMSYTTRVEFPENSIREFQRAANRIAISVLASGLIVGLSFLTLAHLTTTNSNFLNFLLETLVVVALGLGAWLLSSIWRSGR